MRALGVMRETLETCGVVFPWLVRGLCVAGRKEFTGAEGHSVGVIR